jgi:hypothetical protein
LTRPFSLRPFGSQHLLAIYAMPGKTESVSVNSVFPVAGGPSVTDNFNGIPRHIETPSPSFRMLAIKETA